MSFMASRATANFHAFAYLHYDSLSMKCFTYCSFINKLRDSFQSLGLSPGLYAGHSFRRGGAIHAFQAGVPVELIKMLGDWKSDSVQLYLTVPLQVRLMTANLVSKSVCWYFLSHLYFIPTSPLLPTSHGVWDFSL